jgi:hypothetical protein
MMTAVFVKMMADHSWSHIWPMERSKLECREGNMCGKRAEAGMPGILSKPVCEIEMVTSSERVTAMLSVAMKTASRLLKTLKNGLSLRCR